MLSTVDDLAPLLAHRPVTQLARELVPLPRIVAVLEAGRCRSVRGSIRGQERRAALLVRVSSVDSAATTRLAWSFNAACIGTGF
jgi:hypothetical protein